MQLLVLIQVAGQNVLRLEADVEALQTLVRLDSVLDSVFARTGVDLNLRLLIWVLLLLQIRELRQVALLRVFFREHCEGLHQLLFLLVLPESEIFRASEFTL